MQTTGVILCRYATSCRGLAAKHADQQQAAAYSVSLRSWQHDLPELEGYQEPAPCAMTHGPNLTATRSTLRSNNAPQCRH